MKRARKILMNIVLPLVCLVLAVNVAWKLIGGCAGVSETEPLPSVVEKTIEVQEVEPIVVNVQEVPSFKEFAEMFRVLCSYEWDNGERLMSWRFWHPEKQESFVYRVPDGMGWPKDSEREEKAAWLSFSRKGAYWQPGPFSLFYHADEAFSLDEKTGGRFIPWQEFEPWLRSVCRRDAGFHWVVFMDVNEIKFVEYWWQLKTLYDIFPNERRWEIHSYTPEKPLLIVPQED